MAKAMQCFQSQLLVESHHYVICSHELFYGDRRFGGGFSLVCVNCQLLITHPIGDTNRVIEHKESD